MLIENMAMAFHAIRANKMRSFLTMLGIIIGIGSVISIVSIGDTMRGLFSDLYKDVGITQAYISIGYWIDDYNCLYGQRCVCFQRCAGRTDKDEI